MPDASLGWQARLSFAPTGTAVAGFTEAWEFVAEDLRKELTILDTAGLRGTRSHPAERTRDGVSRVGGEIRLHATPALLDLALPRILGAPETADLFPLAESLPEFDVLVDRVARRFLYGGCKVDKAVFLGRPGSLLELHLTIVGKSETVATAAFPAVAPPIDLPYVFQDAVVTIQGVPRQILGFQLTIDNRLAARFTNSSTATDVSATDRIVTLACTTPFTSSEVDLYGANAAGAGAAQLTFTNGGVSLSFTMPRVQFADRSPAVAGRDEIVLHLLGTAKKLGAAAELTVTSDSTP